jgi:predicted DNA-binding transcriptional regulator AlpA
MIIIQMTAAELEQLIFKAVEQALKKETGLTENPNKLLTRLEVAEKFDISLASLHNWVRDGLIPKPINIARRVYFEQQVITEAIQKLRQNKI